jgi:hypothetical protein
VFKQRLYGSHSGIAQEAKAYKKLQALKEWTHIDCDPAGGDGTLDNIEDDVLREIVNNGFRNLHLQASRQAHQRDFSLGSDDEELLEAKAVSEGRLAERHRYQGGEITYIFHVSSERSILSDRQADTIPSHMQKKTAIL